MVEHDEELHVLLASPPTLFDVAVIARMLYAALGPRGWVIHTTRRLSAPRLAIESRLPLRTVMERVRYGARVNCRKPVIIDPGGQPAWRLEFTPDCIVVDYGGGKEYAWRGVRVSGLGIDNPTYEAIAVLYEFTLARRNQPKPVDQRLNPEELRIALHMARKLLEAQTIIGSIELLDPNTVAYALRSILKNYGYIADPRQTSIRIDHENGVLREHIELEAVHKDKSTHKTTIDYNTATHTATIRLPWGKTIHITILPGRRACITPKLCVGEDQQEEPIVIDIESLASL